MIYNSLKFAIISVKEHISLFLTLDEKKQRVYLPLKKKNHFRENQKVLLMFSKANNSLIFELRWRGRRRKPNAVPTNPYASHLRRWSANRRKHLRWSELDFLLLHLLPRRCRNIVRAASSAFTLLWSNPSRSSISFSSGFFPRVASTETHVSLNQLHTKIIHNWLRLLWRLY